MLTGIDAGPGRKHYPSSPAENQHSVGHAHQVTSNWSRPPGPAPASGAVILAGNWPFPNDRRPVQRLRVSGIGRDADFFGVYVPAVVV